MAPGRNVDFRIVDKKCLQADGRVMRRGVRHPLEGEIAHLRSLFPDA